MGNRAKPKIVCMCGSSRYVDLMAVCAWIIERDEHKITMGLHLLPDWYTTVPDHLAETEGVAAAFDELHLRKVELADEIFVINVRNSVGQSTKREVEYAMSLKKPIRWFSHDPVGSKVLDMIKGKI